jgi:hypothetical protein
MLKSARHTISAVGAVCAMLLVHEAVAAGSKSASPTPKEPAAGATKAPAKGTSQAAPDSSMKIDAGSGGRNFDSITVEGEDRVRVQFDRPELSLALDPATAPGLDWESVWSVLGAESYDFVDPMLKLSAFDRSNYAPRPWLDQFREGPVARFRPAVDNVNSWALEVADSRGKTVARFDGKKKPPKEIAWNGLTTDGTPARADLTYSYVLTAVDEAGNKRSFVGDAFQIPPHAATGKDGVGLSFSVPVESARERVPASLLLEAATRLNHDVDPAAPVRVEVTAPTVNLASSIGEEVLSGLRPHLMGAPSRVTVVTLVDAGAAERASVTIRPTR